MKTFFPKAVFGLLAVSLFAVEAAFAAVIDFEDVDPSLISTVTGFDACISDVRIETQGFVVHHPGECAAVTPVNVDGTVTNALFFAQWQTDIPSTVDLYAADNSRFDFLEFDQLVGASNETVVEGYRDGQLVFSELFLVPTGFRQSHQVNWTDLDLVRFINDTPGTTAGGIDNLHVSLAAVPLPASVWLFVGALGLLGRVAHKRCQR